LASEALKDELAPVEPLRVSARFWCAGMGPLFGALAVAPSWAPQGKPIVEVGAAVAALAVAGLPLSYRPRAVATVVLAACVGLLGVLGIGPAAVVAYAVGEWGLLHLIAAAVLPAAVMFRGRYRAYAGARAILAAALALSLPLATYCGLQVEGGSVSVQIASAVALLAVGSSLIGFMGSQTGIAGDWLAGVIVAAVMAQLLTQASVALMPSGATEWVSISTSVAAFGGTAALGAIGVFQLLASRHWQRARQVDVHPSLSEPPSAPPSAPSLPDTWSTRP
jgi:hypothetical protein